MSDEHSADKDAWRKRLGAALMCRGDVYAVVEYLLAEARVEALREAADAVEDECAQSKDSCFCTSASWLREHAAAVIASACICEPENTTYPVDVDCPLHGRDAAVIPSAKSDVSASDSAAPQQQPTRSPR